MILLIDNYDSFTWNLVQRLGELDPTIEVGRDLLVVRNDKISPGQAVQLDSGRGPSHVIISPGPCTPAEAGVSCDIIRVLAGRVPILGVCLGHQCIGALHGMTVARHAVPMHGKTSQIRHDGQGVFAGLPSPMTATRYHSLVVLAETIPPAKKGQDSWKVAAWAEEVVDDPEAQAAGGHGKRRVVMGLRRVWADARKAPLEGVQFHPESFLTEHGPKLLANFLAMGPRPRRPAVPTGA